MLIAIVPLVVAIIGLLAWALASNPLAKSVGEKMFLCGLLVSLFVGAGYTIRLP